MANRKCPTIARCINELEYRFPEEVVRPNFAAIVDEDARFIAREMYLKKIQKTLDMLAEAVMEIRKLGN